MRIVIIAFLASSFVNGSQNVAQELGKLFESEGCIEGTLTSLDVPYSWESSTLVLDKDLANKLSLVNISTIPDEVAGISATARINDIAQFNNIKFYYEVVNEEGPAHQKLFKVSLTLGDETYVGEGPSIKKAKKDAAELALEHTEHRIPPIKLTANEGDNLNIPTVQLNNAAQKLGVLVKYETLDENPETKDRSLTSKVYLAENKKGYLTRLNYSVYHPNHKTVSVEPKATGQPFVVRVHVGERNYIGIGHTVQAAKHDAAAKAIDDIKREGLKEAEVCAKEGHEEQCRLKKDSLKSPVSQVYEMAQKHQLKLDYKIVEENGKSHEKVFVTRCTLGDFVAEGKGKSKKESKREASEAMLKQTTSLPPLSELESAVSALKSKNKRKNKKKKKVIRSQVDKLKMQSADLVSSVVGYFSSSPGSPVEEVGQRKGVKENADKNSKSDYRIPRLTPKDELLRLTQAHGLEAHFSKLQNANTYYTVVSLNTKPPHICLGEGISDLKSQEKAVLRTLNLLNNLGFDLPDFAKIQMESEKSLTEDVSKFIKPDIFDKESDDK